TAPDHAHPGEHIDPAALEARLDLAVRAIAAQRIGLSDRDLLAFLEGGLVLSILLVAVRHRDDVLSLVVLEGRSRRSAAVDLDQPAARGLVLPRLGAVRGDGEVQI